MKSDRWIKEMSPPLIDPFVDHQVSKGVISYGLSSAGYDIRVGDEFEVFTNLNSGILDPKLPDPGGLSVNIKRDVLILPPGTFALAKSIESFKIPRDVIGICQGKSTYARAGVVVPVTPLEPGWEGVLTLELINAGPNPVAIYANEGIAQLTFMEVKGGCEVSYADRKGRYQHQKGIVEAHVET